MDGSISDEFTDPTHHSQQAAAQITQPFSSSNQPSFLGSDLDAFSDMRDDQYFEGDPLFQSVLPENDYSCSQDFDGSTAPPSPGQKRQLSSDKEQGRHPTGGRAVRPLSSYKQARMMSNIPIGLVPALQPPGSPALGSQTYPSPAQGHQPQSPRGRRGRPHSRDSAPHDESAPVAEQQAESSHGGLGNARGGRGKAARARAKSERKFYCAEHNSNLGSKHDLDRHYHDMHPNDRAGNPIESLPCPWNRCHKEFRRLKNLQNHIDSKHAGQWPPADEAANNGSGAQQTYTPIPMSVYGLAEQIHKMAEKLVQWRAHEAAYMRLINQPSDPTQQASDERLLRNAQDKRIQYQQRFENVALQLAGALHPVQPANALTAAGGAPLAEAHEV